MVLYPTKELVYLIYLIDINNKDNDVKRRLPLALAAFVAVILVWLIRPLKSNEWDIEFDPQLQDGKNQYLDVLAQNKSLKNRPNVVIILADDLGMTDISLYGSPYIDTPNIDSIGEQGITYAQAYSTAPICSPSRAGLLTGRYQNRYGFDSQPMTRYARNQLEYLGFKYFINTKPMYLINNHSIPNPDQIERQGMPPTEILLSEALSASGYHCDAVGKWHLGYGDLQFPDNRGFKSFFGFLDAFSYYINPEQEGVESWQFDEFSEKHIWKQHREGFSAILRDGTVVDEKEHLTDAFAREASSRIRDAALSENPFFLYIPFSAPHTPFQALSKYTARFQNIEDPRKRIYYALIAQLDDAVGRILKTLDETGEADNTLVIFSSDNGGATYTGATGNDPLRGGKMSHFEGGLSVPLMMRWPGVIQKGSNESRPVIQMDLFNTIMASAGIPLPEDRMMDGINLLDDSAMDKTVNRPLFWRSDYNHIVQYRQWKLMMNGKDGKIWLYNIAEDREENNNLADVKPEIVEKLKSMFEEWNIEMQKPAWPRVMDYLYDEDGEGYWFAT